MITCVKCEIVTSVDLRREIQRSATGGAPGQAHTDAFNSRLEELRASGYSWDQETRAMIKQCATCAASEQETRDETPSTENPDPETAA